MTSHLLLILVLFQLKHFLADYPGQTHGFFLGKFRQDWGFFLPLVAHCSVHAVMTFGICLAFGASPGKALALAAFDATIHFFMDRLKAGEKYLGRWKAVTKDEYMWSQRILNGSSWHVQDVLEARQKLRGNSLFWNAMGLDQLVHHLTDLAVVWFLVNP